MKKNDEALNEIREARHSISEEHGHDPQKLVNYYIQLQKQYCQSKNDLEQLTFDDRAEIR